MRKIFKANQLGLTLIEILLVIAIMGMISTAFYFNVSKNMTKKVTESADTLLANLRTVRNLAISKTVYKFAGDTEAKYPAGGYGLAFNGAVTPAQYFIYADNGMAPGYQNVAGNRDEIIGLAISLPTGITLNNNADEATQFYYALLNERQVNTNMSVDTSKRYVARIRGIDSGAPKGYQALVRLGEQSIDNFVLTNVGVTFGEYVPSPPPPSNPPKDPADIKF